MKAVDATRILLTRKHTTAKLRKQCARARETRMTSASPIYAEKEEGQPTEYFASKPSEKTDEQRLAAKLRRATREQLNKWATRNLVREAACSGIAERIAVTAATSALRRREKFIALALHHDKLATACLNEIDRREEEISMRSELKAENV